jgi:hypothetical protein
MEQSDKASTKTTPLCPHCRRARGRPNAVTIHQQQRTLRYVCDTCRHHWDVTEPDHDFLLQRLRRSKTEPAPP